LFSIPSPTAFSEGEAARIRILADFNTLNIEPLDLVKLGHTSHLSAPLQPGELVESFDDELLVLARVQDDAAADYWLAAPVWASRRATPLELAATIH